MDAFFSSGLTHAQLVSPSSDCGADSERNVGGRTCRCTRPRYHSFGQRNGSNGSWERRDSHWNHISLIGETSGFRRLSLLAVRLESPTEVMAHDFLNKSGLNHYWGPEQQPNTFERFFNFGSGYHLP